MATPATATGSTPSWENPMTPRNKLATSAYAFNSANANTLNGQSASDFAAASGSASYLQNTTTVQAASFNISGTGRVGGAFTAAGNATFGGNLVVHTATNSNSALRIQSASNHRVFNVDTENSRVSLGMYDNNATLFMLDTKTSSLDPTGFDGSMYYNEARGKMRCYENGAWKNCDTSTKGAPTTRTSNYTAKNGDFVMVNTSGGGFTVTLPAPELGAMITVKKISADGNNISISAGGAIKIDNITTDMWDNSWRSQDYYSDGTQWYRV